MNVRSKEYYINDENKLKKRLNKRSLYVQSLRNPMVTKNIDIIGEQVESGDVSIPRPVQQAVQQVSNYSSSRGDAKNIVNIINALISQISQISQMFTKQITYKKDQIDADFNYVERDPTNSYILFLSFRFADNYLIALSKIKVLFNELRDTYESFLKSVNPNKKEQFKDIINSIIKYFEYWNPFYKSLDISIELVDGTNPQLNEYIYNNIYFNTIDYVEVKGGPNYLSRVALVNTAPFTSITEITSNFVEINYNYNDILKIIYDTLGTFVDRIVLPKEKIKYPKEIDENIKLLTKEKTDKEKEIADFNTNIIDQINIEIGNQKKLISDAEDEINDGQARIDQARKDIAVIFVKYGSDEDTSKEYINLIKKDPKYVKNIDKKKIRLINKKLTNLGIGEVRIELLKIKQSEMLIETNIEIKKRETDILNEKIRQYNQEIKNRGKLERELEDIENKLKDEIEYKPSKMKAPDYTPKKGSGRGQSIKYIPKKGSGRSQYVDPYDRSIPKRYM